MEYKIRLEEKLGVEAVLFSEETVVYVGLKDFGLIRPNLFESPVAYSGDVSDSSTFLFISRSDINDDPTGGPGPETESEAYWEDRDSFNHLYNNDDDDDDDDDEDDEEEDDADYYQRKRSELFKQLNDLEQSERREERRKNRGW